MSKPKPPDSSDKGDTPSEKPKGLLERIKSGSLRTQLLVVAGVVAALMLWGPLRGCSGVTVTQDEAVATARAQIDFEPERTDAKLLRQGATTTAWIVVFTIPDPDGGRDDYLRHTEVRVHAGSGEVMDVTPRVP